MSECCGDERARAVPGVQRGPCGAATGSAVRGGTRSRMAGLSGHWARREGLAGERGRTTSGGAWRGGDEWA